jgi:hypothetical protein
MMLMTYILGFCVYAWIHHRAMRRWAIRELGDHAPFVEFDPRLTDVFPVESLELAPTEEGRRAAAAHGRRELQRAQVIAFELFGRNEAAVLRA